MNKDQILFDFSRELEKYLPDEISSFRKGQIVKCRVADIGDDKIIVDLGSKTEGVIKKSEVDRHFVEKGKIIEAMIIGRTPDGLYKLSFRAAKEKKMAEYLSELMRARKAVIGIVLRKNKNVFEVDVGDFSGLGIGEYIAICPASHAEDIKVGNPYEFVIKERTQDGKFIISRKEYLQVLLEEERKRISQNLKPGAIMECKVIRVTDLYAEIDFGGGVRGKILRDDVSWVRVESCKDKLVKGQVVSVKILETEPTIRASLKHLGTDPWVEVEKVFKVGDVVEGIISDIRDFGVFVRVKVKDNEIEALLPFSEAGWNKELAKGNFEIGQPITATIINLSPQDKKMILSIKSMLPDPYKILSSSADEVYKATVIHKNKRGYIVDVDVHQAQVRIRALLPKSEVSWLVNDVELNSGDQIYVKPIAVRGKDVIVSKRKVEDNIVQKIFEEIKGKHIKVKILFNPTKVDKGLWVVFEKDGKALRGFIPAGNLVSKMANYSKGEELKCQAIGVDNSEGIIIFSEVKSMLEEVSGGKAAVSLGAFFENLTKQGNK